MTAEQAAHVEHVILVRYSSDTYIARSNGKSASCTAGKEQAADALARKLMGKRPYTLARVFQKNDHVYQVFGQVTGQGGAHGQGK